MAESLREYPLRPPHPDYITSEERRLWLEHEAYYASLDYLAAAIAFRVAEALQVPISPETRIPRGTSASPAAVAPEVVQ